MKAPKEEHELGWDQGEDRLLEDCWKKEAVDGAVDGDAMGEMGDLGDVEVLPTIKVEGASKAEASQPVAGPSRLTYHRARTSLNPPHTDPHTAHQSPSTPQLSDNSSLPRHPTSQIDIEIVSGPLDAIERLTDEAMQQPRTARPKQNTKKARSLAAKKKKEERDQAAANGLSLPLLNGLASSSNPLARPDYPDVDIPMTIPVRRVGRTVGPITEGRKRPGERMAAAEAKREAKKAAKAAKEAAKQKK